MSRRIALFMPSLNGGGAQRVMLTLADGFVRAGLATDLILTQATGEYRDQVPAGVRLVDLGARRSLAGLPALVRYLRREEPAALLSTVSHANLVALWARQLARVPTRVVVRESNTMSDNSRGSARRRQRLVPSLARRFYPWADGIVAVSEGVARDLVRTTKLPADRIRVLPNPIVTPELTAMAREPLSHPWFAEGEPPVVLAVGRLAKQKDFPTLLRAFGIVRRLRPARLVILGEGTERTALESLAETIGVKAEVAVPGFVPNPFSYMARAGVFVLSSAWEGMPGVLIQALACGVPVVATDCESGPREVLKGGRYGRLVPVGDVEGLAAAITSTLEQPVAAPLESIGPYTRDAAVSQYLSVLGATPDD
jgi:glycosyltransferase involved in cell wall biosynthesis